MKTTPDDATTLSAMKIEADDISDRRINLEKIRLHYLRMEEVSREKYVDTTFSMDEKKLIVVPKRGIFGRGLCSHGTSFLGNYGEDKREHELSKIRKNMRDIQAAKSWLLAIARGSRRD